MEPTEKQMIALMLKSRGFSLTEIAKMLGTSKQNVASLIRRGKNNISKFEKLYKVMKACTCPSFKLFEKGNKLYDVAEEILRVADEKSIKLKGNVNDVVSYLKFEGDIENGLLATPHGIAVCEDGDIVVLKGDALELFSKLISVYENELIKSDPGDR